MTLAEFYKYATVLGLTGGTTPPTGALLAVNDLNDVASKPTSRVNLQVPAFSVFAGNPNGNVAGTIGDFVMDLAASNALFQCTTSGTTTTAVWSQLFAAASSTYFISTGGALSTFTLPVAPQVHDLVYMTGFGTGGWKLQQNIGQIIHTPSGDTTTGTGGSLASQAKYDSAILQCVVALTDFVLIAGTNNLLVT